MITEDCVAFSLRPNATQCTSTQKGHRVVHRPRWECFSDKEPCPGVARARLLARSVRDLCSSRASRWRHTGKEERLLAAK